MHTCKMAGSGTNQFSALKDLAIEADNDDDITFKISEAMKLSMEHLEKAGVFSEGKSERISSSKPARESCGAASLNKSMLGEIIAAVLAGIHPLLVAAIELATQRALREHMGRVTRAGQPGSNLWCKARSGR